MAVEILYEKEKGQPGSIELPAQVLPGKILDFPSRQKSVFDMLSQLVDETIKPTESLKVRILLDTLRLVPNLKLDGTSLPFQALMDALENIRINDSAQREIMGILSAYTDDSVVIELENKQRIRIPAESLKEDIPLEEVIRTRRNISSKVRMTDLGILGTVVHDEEETTSIRRSAKQPLRIRRTVPQES